MRLLSYLVKSLNVLNLLLIAAVIVVALYLLLPLLNPRVAYKAPAVAKQAAPAQEDSSASNQSPPASDYMVVAEQNVFHPERKIPPEGKDEKALPKPELLLYGTLVSDGMRLAYIEDKKSPQSTPGRGNRQAVVKQGDLVSGFLLKSVETDKIVLVRGEEQIVVYLSDAKKTRTQVAPAQAAGPAGSRPSPMPGAQPSPMPTAPPGTQHVSPPVQAAPLPQPTPASGAAASQPIRQPSRPPRTNPTQTQTSP